MTMTYPYSQDNLLDVPHSYMYTPFQGASLFQSYLMSRSSIIRRHVEGKLGSSQSDHVLMTYSLPVLEKLFAAASSGDADQFCALLRCGDSGMFRPVRSDGAALTELAKAISQLTTTQSISTVDLLRSLIAAHLSNMHDVHIKLWLDRLIQRFEVTKKLYVVYPAGFKRGEGANKIVRLYWLFALALCLYYTSSQGLKYLNTLLKVCDLLCSLPENMLHKDIPEGGLPMVLAAEVVNVRLIAEKKGLALAFR